MGTMDNFFCNLTISFQTNPNFGGKPTSFVAVLAKNTCVYSFRMVIPFELQY